MKFSLREGFTERPVWQQIKISHTPATHTPWTYAREYTLEARWGARMFAENDNAYRAVELMTRDLEHMIFGEQIRLVHEVERAIVCQDAHAAMSTLRKLRDTMKIEVEP